MNHPSLLLLFALGCAPSIAAPATDASVASAETTTNEKASLTPAQLDELLAPIALYPDPLVAILLPASTFPADVVLAARYVAAGGKPETFDTQPWDDSVKAIARYPEVLKWMDQNLEWTRQVGAAFLQQPAEVLTATQRLRTAARAAGNLTSSPEQTVVVERGTIRILPAQPEVIFVPVYDASWIYRPSIVSVYHSRPLLRFSTGYHTGSWLSYHCNWNYKTVVVIDRPHRVKAWHHHPRWVCPGPSAGYAHHVWHPSPVHVRAMLREREHLAQQRVPRPTLNDHLIREPAQAGTPSGATLAATTESRPSPRNSAPSTPRPDTREPAVSTNPATTRPGGLADSSRRGPAPATGTAAVYPPRGERAQDSSRHGQVLSRPTAQRLLPAPAPSPSPTASPANPAPTTRRIHSSTTAVSGDAASAFRSRPTTTTPTTNQISAPVRQSSPTIAPPRHERENRQMSVPAPSAVQPSSPRHSAGAVQSTPMPRRGNLSPVLAPGSPAETNEASASRRAR